jgi:hypothetical protein
MGAGQELLGSLRGGKFCGQKAGGKRKSAGIAGAGSHKERRLLLFHFHGDGLGFGFLALGQSQVEDSQLIGGADLVGVDVGRQGE